jgi:hypothetical protein
MVRLCHQGSRSNNGIQRNPRVPPSDRKALTLPKPIDEYALQRAFVIWLTGNPDRDGKPRTTPALAPGVEFWHTPNGGERRDAFEGKRLNDIGLKKGIHDLLFLRPTQFSEGVFGLLFGVEWKKPDAKRIPVKNRTPQRLAARADLLRRGLASERVVDMLSDAQLDMHPRLLRAGLAASIVVDNLGDAKDFCLLHRLTNY